MGQMILNGCTVALRRKFSVSQFWKDCVKYKCTVIENTLLNDIICLLCIHCITGYCCDFLRTFQDVIIKQTSLLFQKFQHNILPYANLIFILKVNFVREQLYTLF